MSETPRTDAVDAYIRTRREFSITDHQVWQEHGEHLERELNEANKRIKRLEEAGDEAIYPFEYAARVRIWTEAKEAKL